MIKQQIPKNNKNLAKQRGIKTITIDLSCEENKGEKTSKFCIQKIHEGIQLRHMNKYIREKAKTGTGAKPYRKTVYERNQKQGGGHHTGAKLTRIIRHTDLIRHKK